MKAPTAQSGALSGKTKDYKIGIFIGGKVQDCAIGAFIGLHGQKRILKNSDLGWGLI
jgi:hypothetical protein